MLVKDAVGKWRIIWYCTPNAEISGDDKLLDLIEAEGKVLKQGRRSLVKRIELEGQQLVVKQPLDKNRRTIERIKTWFIKSEVVKQLDGMQQLIKADLETTRPIVALEKRRLGMVINSFALYQYRAGITATTNDYQEITRFIHRLHKVGIRHGDPHTENFLIDNSGEMFVIDCKAKPLRGGYGACMDWLMIKELNPGIQSVDQLQRSGLTCALAHAHVAYRKLRRRVKSKD